MEPKEKIQLAHLEALATHNAGELLDLPMFGLFCLSVTGAADLLAAGRWFSGDSTIEMPEDETRDWRARSFKDRLSTESAQIAKQLVASINRGELKTCRIRRDLDGHVVPLETFAELEDVERWAESRDINWHDVQMEYQDQESAILYEASDTVVKMRYLNTAGWKTHDNRLVSIDIDNATVVELRDTLRYVLNVVDSFAAPHKPSMDQEPTPKRRKSFLAIIGGLLLAANLDLRKRGTTAKVAALTEHFGLAVGEDTVGKILGEVAELQDKR